MFFYRLAFDPDYARLSPGLLTTLAAIEAAAAEGVERVEFLGGDERVQAGPLPTRTTRSTNASGFASSSARACRGHGRGPHARRAAAVQAVGHRPADRRPERASAAGRGSTADCSPDYLRRGRALAADRVRVSSCEGLRHENGDLAAIEQFVKTAQTRARTLVWGLRAQAGWPTTPSDGLRILFYHRVADDPGDPLVVRCDVFAAEMALLAERGYEVLDVVEALDRLYAGTLESKTIALTFDDGYVDNVVNAMPVLERHGFRGTVFVVTDLVSGKGAFAKGHGSPAPLLGWAEIKRLDGSSPLTFEAHTVTHPNLASLSDAESWVEIELGGARSETCWAGRPVAFCYPGGFLGPREHEYVRRAGFRYADHDRARCSTLAETDPFLVRRTQMNRATGSIDFAAKLDGSHDVPLLGPALYRRLKYGADRPGRAGRLGPRRSATHARPVPPELPARPATRSRPTLDWPAGATVARRRLRVALRHAGHRERRLLRRCPAPRAWSRPRRSRDDGIPHA